MNPENLTLVILAGNPKCLDTDPGSGRTFLDIALDVPQELPFAKTVVVSNVAPPSLDGSYVLVNSADTLYGSLSNGMEQVKTDYAFALSTDLLSTPHAVQAFLREVGKRPEAPFYCGVAKVDQCRLIREGIRTHFVCRYGKIRFASAYVIKKDFLASAQGYARAVFDQRKNIPVVAWHVSRYLVSELLITIFTWTKPGFPRLVLADPVLAVDYDDKAKHLD